MLHMTIDKAALTRRETQILDFLANRSTPASVRTVLTEVFGYHPNVETHTVETHMWRLRAKIEDDPKNPKFLLSVSGGYVLDPAFKKTALGWPVNNKDRQ